MKAMIIMLVLADVLVVSCGGKLPETRYYQLTPAPAHGPRGEAAIVLDALTTDQGYDDERIVYRADPYRLDYYQYHRWSAAPGVMVGNFLEQALERSGRFRSVIRDTTPDSLVVLGGRVVAIEEVDTSSTRWNGRIVVELMLTDAKSGATLWVEQYEETEPMQAQNPEGLAKALSTALQRIAERVAPIVGDLTDEQARAHTLVMPLVGKLSP